MYRLIVDDVNKFRKDIEPFSDKVAQMSYVVLRQHSRPVVDSIFGGNIRPVKILVSVRTDRTNEIIVNEDGAFYIDCTASYPNLHPLDDTVLLSAKSAIEKTIDCHKDLESIITRTSPYPVGACIVDDCIYVYMNVVIDHTLKSEEYFNLNEGYRLESIKNLTPKTKLDKVLKDSLVLVKGDN